MSHRFVASAVPFAFRAAVDPADGRTGLFTSSASTGSRSHDAGLRFVPLFEDGFESGGTSEWGS